MKKFMFLCLLILVCACTRHEKPNVEDHFQKIQQKIDRREYSEAEKDLQAILVAEPENERARMILASVSVHRAGITLKDYFLLEKISHLQEAPSAQVIPIAELGKLNIPPTSDLGKGIEFIKQIDLLAGRAQEIVQKFDQIPSVSDEGAEHLRTALVEMGKLTVLQDGNALYRGVIKLFYFKYLWTKGYFLRFGDKQFCSQTVSDLKNALDEFDLFTVGMIRDIGRGFPKSKPEFEKHIQQMEMAFQDTQKFLNGIQKTSQTVEQALLGLAGEQNIEGLKCDF